MITRGTNEPVGAQNSPSSRADTAPLDSELPAAVAAADQPDVVDVTGSGEAWTRAPARRASEPAALRASKRAPAKAGSAEAAVDPRKGKNKLVKRPTPRGSAGLPKKSLSDSDIDPDSELEDKAPTPSSKKPQKSSATAKTKPNKETPSSKRPTTTSRSDGGFDLTSFMASFTPGVGTEEHASPETRITSELSPSGASAASQDSRVMQAQVQALQDEVARLRALLARHETPPTAANWARERRIFHDTACFALRPTSPDATTYASPDTQVATIGTSVAYLGGLTLRSGSAIQPPTAIQHSQTIQSGLAIQSPTAIQPVQTIQPVHPFNKAHETSVLTSAEIDMVTAQPANPLDTACALHRLVASPD
ncbi:unnamed protein product [Phytophthora fragariaefolia]|uniref:Unnamed protein product n=1 Tax=Phytophthora fragariaefolia TaxID=1490495 RepID=A0A9W6XVG1_9STRA|nr:unnamed protein product [Phytophthora fragariaefolia]